jgi:hypothetical protein
MEPTGGAAIFLRYPWVRRVTAIGGRYGIATLGPLSVSAANFLASLALLRALPLAEFGLFAFLLVVIGFCISLSNALIVAPYTVAANQIEFGADETRTFFKANLLFSVMAGLVCGSVALGMHAGGTKTSLLFGLYGSLAMLRWFARAHAYALHAPRRVATVDIAYAILLLSGLALMWILHDLTLDTVLVTFVSAAAASVAASGKDYLKKQFVQAFAGRLRRYASIWHNQSRWTLLGVITTEASLNAHAYLVTLIAGPAAFAPLAAAALFMRPVSMCSNSLIQLERPAMARAIAAGDTDAALHAALHFRWAIMLVWFATVAAAAIIFIWFPTLILTEHYDPIAVMVATGLWACIDGIHVWLAPEAALLQAADRFRLLAGVTVRSCVVTITAAFLFLITLGPTASLGGVLAGEIVIAQRFMQIRRAQRLGHE